MVPSYCVVTSCTLWAWACILVTFIDICIAKMNILFWSSQANKIEDYCIKQT